MIRYRLTRATDQEIPKGSERMVTIPQDTIGTILSQMHTFLAPEGQIVPAVAFMPLSGQGVTSGPFILPLDAVEWYEEEKD